ncbi:MAG TPA: amino acid adenylation domain-containing protein, partial [Herpetosiphonaceae bacterium]
MDTTSFSAEDLKLLAYMLEDEGVDLIQTQAIPRREQTAALPLAFAQERLWFLSHLEPNSPAYNIPVALRLRGQLDIAALQHSFTALVQRHEVLRTNVAVRQGQPIQTLATVGDVPLPILDLSHLPPDEREAEAKRYAEAEAHRPFDLAHDLLIRTTLLQLDRQEHVLVITQHHIVSDGWSTGVMVREIEAFYTAYQSGQAPQLPELPIQYADYAAWQRDWLQAERLAEELAYWTATLADAPTVLALPTDRPRPAIKTYAGAIHRFSLPVALSESLIRLSRQEQVTLFTTVLAAFQVLLCRYTRQTDLVVGTPVANRSQAEIQPLIGLFVNTLALRTDLSGNPTFRQLLQRSHDVVLGSYAHQDLPFEKVVEVIQPERDLSYTPVFQVLFQLDEAPETMRVPQLSMEYIEFERVAAKFDLSLAVINTPQGLSATIEYSSDLFQPATIARMAGHFEMLVSGIVAAPDCPILDLPMLTGTERSDILGAWDGGASYLQDGCLHERFEAQAARTPDAIAVAYAASDAPAERLTYAELNTRANQLAHHLQTLGVGRDTLVGLYVERSLDLAIGLLAILKAGGAYLPLDPSYPAERLAATLDDAEVTVLVTQSWLATELPRSVPHMVCLDRADLFAAADTENPASGASADSLAYVIYTSGSTGKPKGVLVTHANVTRLFDATHDWYGFDERDVWTLFHSAAFDFSVWEFWGALLYGGRLVIVPYLVSRSPEALYALLAAEQVTVLNQTPSAFRQLIWAEQQAAEQRSLALRYVIFGGEALDLQSLRPWFERHGDQQPQLVNMYGITETTVHVTYRPITLADLDSAPGSVIGRPIPDLQLYVLDQRRQLVPLGVPGELYVGGAGVARGYLNRPELTAERFIADPFQPHTGARLYKTGDLARQLPGGDLQYLGRIDHQVKIRGFRIELGEIEAAISAHPAVREVVVVAREERVAGGKHAEPGGLRLVAYVVGGDGSADEGTDAPLSAAALRQFLQTTLPDHMLPSAWVFLDAMPLTPTGKLDRRSLPAPEQQAAETAETYVAPRTPVEQALADIWAAVLHRERVGIDDNFFMLGGDSILSVRLLALAKERGLSLSLQDLFRYQTIGALSQHLQPAEDQLDAAPHTTPFSLVADADRPKLPPDVEDAYPLTRLQAGMIYHMELGADVADYHNVTSFYLHGAIDLDLLRAAAQQIVARHPVLRTSFDLVTYSEPLQLVHAAATMEIQQHDICHLTEAEQVEHLQAYIQAELRRHFDLAQPPLLRLHLHRRTAATFQLTITEFHPILDGWSLNTVLAEIFAVYFALADQQPLTLPPLQSTFRDFVALERQTLESEACRRYWSDKLEDATLLQLPRWPQVERTTRQIGSVRLPIASALTASLQQVAAQASVPLKTVLLAAHLRVMHLLAPQANVLTGLVLHGRSEAQDGEKISGLFLNTLPLRLQPTHGTWRDLIRETFAAELELVDIRRYPLAALQQQWGREQPLFEVLFNFTNFHVLDDLVESRRLELLPSTIEGLTSSNIPLQVAFGFTSGSAQLELMLDYHTSILCAEQAQQISEYYIAALTALSRDPESRYETADLLSQREKDELLVVRNATAQAYPDATYPELLAQQVARTPADIAVTAEDGELTYQELSDAAAQLAQVLQQAYGIGRGSRVALLLPRSCDLVVALLAIWQAGGAFVPLDAAFPPERIQFLVQDSGAALVL